MTILQYCTDEEEGHNQENKDETSSDKDEPSDQDSVLKTENLSESENNPDNKYKFSCQLCPRYFISETSLQMHMLGHPSQPKRILSFNNMQQRINQVIVTFETVKEREENANNNNIDDKCNNEDSEETDDEFDEFREKTNSPCPICGKMISNRGNLKVHLETHRPKGRYACDICGRM